MIDAGRAPHGVIACFALALIGDGAYALKTRRGG